MRQHRAVTAYGSLPLEFLIGDGEGRGRGRGWGHSNLKEASLSSIVRAQDLKLLCSECEANIPTRFPASWIESKARLWLTRQLMQSELETRIPFNQAHWITIDAIKECGTASSKITAAGRQSMHPMTVKTWFKMRFIASKHTEDYITASTR